MAHGLALGLGIAGLETFESIQPDIILLSGDRIETFIVIAMHIWLPLAHIQAGDKVLPY